MIFLLIVCWLVLLIATADYVVKERAKRHRAYLVSYQMQTATGYLVGNSEMKWNSNASLPEIRDYIRNECIESQKKNGGPEISSNVVITSIIEVSWTP